MMLVRLCDDVLSVRCRGGQPRAAAAATAARVPLVLLALLVCSERVEYVSGFAFSFGRHPGPGDWAQFSTAALDGPLPVLSRASAFSTSCVPIPRNMSLCQGLEYSRMRLPNLLEHDTIDEALEQSASWVHLHKLRCHADTQKFLCSLFAPVCLETPIFPCRSLCEAVRDACEGAMLKYGYPWPEMVGCEKFPEGEMCVTAGDNNDRGSAVCRACTQPENTESLLDNFCRADFVIRARVRRAKGSTVLKTKMSRVFKVTESIIAEKDLKSPEFRNANMSDCCSSLDRKISKRNPHLLIMGTRDGDGNLVPTFLMEWRRGSMSFKKSVKMMLKINCAHSSAVDINPLDPVSGRKDLSKPVPGAKGQRQFVRKTNEGEGDDEDEDDNDDDEDASKNNSNSRHSNNSNNKGSLEKVRRPLNSASPLSSSSPPPPKIQFDLSENFRRELELHSIAAEQEKKAHEEQQLRQQLGSDKQSSPAPRKRKEGRRRKGDRGRAAAGRLPVDRDGSEDDPRLAQKSHKARGREHKRKSAARTTTTTPSTTTALQSGDVEVAKERREHAPMSVYHRVPKPHEKHEGRRHNQQEPAGEMEMIVDPVELHGPLKIEKKVHRDELEVRHHSKIHDHKDVSLNRTPYRADPHHHPKEQQQQHHQQQQQQHSHRHQQQHQQQQQQWHVNSGHGDGGPAVQREDSIVTTHKSVHDNKSSNGQHRHSSVEHGLSSELPYIHTPSDEEIVKLAGGEDATSRQSQRHDHHEHQHHHQHQHHGDGEDGGSSRPSKVKVVEEDEVVTQVAEVEQPAGQAGGTHDRHHDHHQHSTQQNHRRPGGHEVRHHEEPQLHHHHRHVHGLEKATTESTETGGGNREVLQKAATLDSPREEEFLTVLPVIPDEMRAKGDGVAVGEGDDEGSDTTGVNDAYGEVTITSDLSLLRSSSAALDVATTTLATSTSGSAPDVVTTREADPAVKVRDSQKRGRKRKSGRRRHHKKKKANTAEGLTTTTTTATATTTTTAVPPPIESDTVTGPYEAE